MPRNEADEEGVKKRTATQKLVCATNYAPAQAKLRSAEETKALRFVKHVNSHSERIDGWIADNLLTAASTTAVVRNKFLTAVPLLPRENAPVNRAFGQQTVVRR